MGGQDKIPQLMTTPAAFIKRITGPKAHLAQMFFFFFLLLL